MSNRNNNKNNTDNNRDLSSKDRDIDLNGYTFRFQYVKVAWYIIGGLLTIPLFVYAAFLIKEDSFILMLISMFVPMVITIWIAVKKSKAADCITLSSEGFTSEFYGRILYADIKKISGPSIWINTPIALILKLKSGRKLIWALATKDSLYNSKEDAFTFNLFTDALAKKMDAYYATNPVNSQYNNADASSSNAQTATITSNPAQSLKKGVTVKKVAKTALIPLSSILVLMLALKNCGIDYIKDKKDQEVRAIFQSSESRYSNTVDQAKQVMDSVEKIAGPIFLYTNDSGLTLKLLPDINTETADRLSSVPVLAHVSMTDSLKKFVAHPDSFDYNIIIQTAQKDILQVRKSVFNYKDSADSWLYLACYDPDLRMGDNGQVTKDSTDKTAPPFIFTTGIPIYKNRSMLESMDRASMNLKMLLARTKFNNHYKVYLLALSGKEHIPLRLFKDAMAVLNGQLLEIQGDTSRFHLEIR